MFSLAGIWESGGTSPGAVDTFVILTMAAAPAIADIHHRQPLILDDDATAEWLRPGCRTSGSSSRGRRRSAVPAYDRWPVSALVNSPRNDSPELLDAGDEDWGWLAARNVPSWRSFSSQARRLTVRLCGRTLRGPGHSRLSEGGQ